MYYYFNFSTQEGSTIQYLITRLRNSVNNKSLTKIADSLFTSKIIYGIQLLGKTRLNTEDVKNEELECIQKVQNKLLYDSLTT